MTGDNGIIRKMCAKCRRLVSADALVCPHCGGILFIPVDLSHNGEEHNER